MTTDHLGDDLLEIRDVASESGLFTYLVDAETAQAAEAIRLVITLPDQEAVAELTPKGGRLLVIWEPGGGERDANF